MSKLKYVNSTTTKMIVETTGKSMELLWGDSVTIRSGNKRDGLSPVKARGVNGFVNVEDLGDQPLLELYFIDVGQGDGVLIVTPERKHILLDGGYTRSKQPHGKSAADFVDWKFKKDYNMDTILIDDMISSHNDADHYGGLWDLINLELKDELAIKTTKVKNFYHAGVSWWTKPGKKRFLGDTNKGFLTSLLEDNASLDKALYGPGHPRLQGEWAEFIKCIHESGARVRRLSCHPDYDFKYVPGYEANKEVAIKILGPIERTINGKPALKDLKSDSQNTNGNSLLLRLDYGRTRILLTGDLNQKSQEYILESLKGYTQELGADIMKSCHHGSDDCSFTFLQHVNASATIISSGDDETHAHPRPAIVAASGATGFKHIENDKIITPLIYSTEISRSVRLCTPKKVSVDNYSGPDLDTKELKNVTLDYSRVASGALKPAHGSKTLDKLMLVDGIVYGLVNVRTDGERIVCATLNEGKSEWDLRIFTSRF